MAILGNILGNLLGKADTIIDEVITSQEEKLKLKNELQKIIQEQEALIEQEVTKRWESDNKAESYITKNIRPLSLAFLTLSMFTYVILDSSLDSFKIDQQWISLLGNLLMLVYGGYFGARTLEKIRKIK